ncbi:MAG: DUF3330 domain-containing protein [Gammaproteobacteria bacterium]|nr:DUF3330 domain-containing protein [Gammaproteobacteria bacterium]
MTTKERAKEKKEVEVVLPTCEICMKEIPSSAALSVECGEYVQYFCGSDCYARWKDKADEANK